jgi:cytoskeletal protein CcmA (bactofilin family)
MLKRKEKLQFESPERLNRLVEGSKIVGDLIADSSLRIDGEVKGNVSTSSKVVVGESGLIKGNLFCQEADIEGKVDGKLSIEGLLILREKAKVVGDIQTVKLHIEEGAVFLGNCNMGKPTSNSKSVEVSKSEVSDNIVY